MWFSDRLLDCHASCKKLAVFCKWRRIYLPVEWLLVSQKKKKKQSIPRTSCTFLSVTFVTCHMPATQNVRRACQKRHAKTVLPGMQMYLMHHCCFIWKLRHCKSRAPKKYPTFTGAIRGSSESKFLIFFTYIKIIYVLLLRRKANWMGHILRINCPIKHIIHENIEGRKEATRRRGRRRKQLLYDLKEMIGYWELKEAALYHPLKGNRYGRGYGPVRRATKKWINRM